MNLQTYWHDSSAGLSVGAPARGGSRRPLLAPGDEQRGVQPEEELLTQSLVSVYFGEVKQYKVGSCMLTSHRLIWIDAEVKVAKSLLLADISRVEATAYLAAGFLGLSSPKITLYIATRTGMVAPSPDYVYLSFKEGGRDEFQAAVQGALLTKAWVVKPVIKDDFSTTQAGLGGVMRNAERAQRERSKALDGAFQDMSALMVKAKDIVKLTQRFASSDESKDPNELNNLLLNMGIPSPVTRTSAGADYHRQLARQLGEFMRDILAKAGGTLTLTAAYCVFNRARGTQLISPEDMKHACGLFASLGIPIRLHAFDSGFLVLQSESQWGSAVTTKLQQASANAPHGIAAYDVSRLLDVSLILAKEHLLHAEHEGLLCRDEAVEGVRFYPNLFCQ